MDPKKDLVDDWLTEPQPVPPLGSSVFDQRNQTDPKPSSSLWLPLLLSAAAVLPVWLPNYPPMADLPHHGSQVALLHELHQQGFPFSSLFHINWFYSYLFGYLLIYVLVPICGIVAACKAVLSLYVIGLTMATAGVLRSVGSHPFWAVLCIFGTYGFTYQWGFLNYLTAAPLGMLFLWFVLRAARRPMTVGMSVLLAVFAVALFFCHALICGFFGLCAVLCLLAESPSVKAAAVRILPLAAVVPVALLWTHATLAHPSTRRANVWDLGWHYAGEIYYSHSRHEQTLHSLGWGRITGLFPRVLGVIPSWQAILLGVVLFSLPFLAGMRMRRRPALWFPFTLCIAVLLFAPATVFGTDFVFQRFSVLLLPLFVLALEPGERSARSFVLVRPVAVVLALLWIGFNAMRALRFNQETRGFEHALALMAPGQRILSLDFDHDDHVFISPTFIAFPQWYAAQKHGVTEPSVAMMFPEMVVYRPGQTPKAVLWGFEWSPGMFDWKSYSGEQYRYFVVRSAQDESAKLFDHASCAVTQQLHEGEWWLYERAANCPAATASSR